LSNNNMSRCSVVRGVNFLVARRALIDLRWVGASTSGGMSSSTPCTGSVGDETFLGVS
jgi:hypothetical protein